MFDRGFSIVPLLCLTACGGAAAQQWRSVEEYGLHAAFPGGSTICEGLTGGSHLHGGGMPLDGDCEQSRRAVSVWADWNASFEPSPEEAAFCSAGEGSSLVAGARLRLAFPGRPSATCRFDQPDGGIRVHVSTQAWRWPEWRTTDDPDLKTPLVNYSAYLRTTARNLDSDLRAFRALLRSVRLTPPQVCPAEGECP